MTFDSNTVLPEHVPSFVLKILPQQVLISQSKNVFSSWLVGCKTKISLCFARQQ